jgi:nicotinamidase/pyrazinamidase
MKNILIVVDMQNDFIDGALGTKEAEAIVPAVHCIKGTAGWQIRPEIMALLSEDRIIDKPSFGSVDLAAAMCRLSDDASGKDMKIELCGVCTDICVVSNALLLKAFLPEAEVRVDPACCAGVTPEAHEAALSVMRSCQVLV